MKKNNQKILAFFMLLSINEASINEALSLQETSSDDTLKDMLERKAASFAKESAKHIGELKKLIKNNFNTFLNKDIDCVQEIFLNSQNRFKISHHTGENKDVIVEFRNVSFSLE